MNLRQLRYFAKVVEAGNMTRAAEALNVAQPALGLQIRQLEEQLGVPLLVRHSRGVSATEAGQLLYERALDITMRVNAAARDVAALSGSSRERLRVGLSPSLMGAFGPELVLRAQDEMPQLALVLIEDLSFGLVDAVVSDEIEIALAYEVDDQPGLTRDVVMEEDLLLVGAPDRIGVEEPLTLTEALSHPLVLGGRRDAVRRMLEAAAERLAIQPTIAFEVQSITGMKALAVRGLAMAVLPQASIVAERQSGDLAARAIVDPPLARRLSILTATPRPRSDLESQFRRLVMDMLDGHASRSNGLARLISPRT